MNIDDLSPATVGESLIGLSLSPETTTALVGQLIVVVVDYSKCPGGVILPLDMIIQGPTDVSYVEKVFRKTLPLELAFVPIASGLHLVALREQAHNRWFGSLRIDVKGDPFGKL